MASVKFSFVMALVIISVFTLPCCRHGCITKLSMILTMFWLTLGRFVELACMNRVMSVKGISKGISTPFH